MNQLCSVKKSDEFSQEGCRKLALGEIMLQIAPQTPSVEVM